MYQRDYILRMIQQAMEMLHKVMFLRKNRQLEEALALLNQAMKQLLGLHSKLVRALSVKDLLQLLSKTGEVDLGKCLVLGDMLKVEALLLEDMGDRSEARLCRLKAIELLLTVRQQEKRGDWDETMNQLVDELLPPVAKVEKSPALHRLLFSYYEEAGHLAKAEDELFHSIEALQAGSHEEELGMVISQAIDKVEAWRGLTLEQVSASGLTEAEIEDLADELRQIKQKLFKESQLRHE